MCGGQLEVGADGSGLERLKAEANLKAWHTDIECLDVPRIPLLLSGFLVALS